MLCLPKMESASFAWKFSFHAHLDRRTVSPSRSALMRFSLQEHFTFVVSAGQSTVLALKGPIKAQSDTSISEHSILHFQIGANAMLAAWPIRPENRAFSINGKQQSKTSRTGKPAIRNSLA